MKTGIFFLAAILLMATLPAVAQVPIEGVVLGHDGRPVAGARVEAFPWETATDQRRRWADGRPRAPLVVAQTAADGGFRMLVPVTAAWIQASAEGLLPDIAEIPRDRPLELSLQPMNLRRSTVMAGDRPVPDARIIWTSPNGVELQLRTESDGSFEIPNSAEAPSELTVSHKDYSPLSAYVVSSSSAPQKLEPGVRITGTAIDGATRKAVEGAEVWIDDRWLLSRTDSRGGFVIANGPADWESLTVRTSQAIAKVRRKALPLVIPLAPARRVSGSVVDARTQRPLDGVTVAIRTEFSEPATGRTDARGQYTIGGLGAGRYETNVTRSGYQWEDEKSPSLDLTSVASIRFDTNLTPVPRIEGVVVDEAQRPVNGAFVALGIKGSPQIYATAWLKNTGAWTRTDHSGRFSLAAPVPGDREPPFFKDRPILVLHPAFAGQEVSAPALPQKSPVRVTLVRGTELRGRVTGPDGNPASDAEINLAEEGSIGGSLTPSVVVLQSLRDVGWTRSDAEGRFAVPVRATFHHLIVRKAGFAPSLLRHFDPRTGKPAEVVLERALSLRGRITRPIGRGVGGVRVALHPDGSFSESEAASGETDTEGAFEIAGLASGVYRFSATSEDLGIFENRTVEIPRDDLQVVLPASFTLRGQVLDASTRKAVNTSATLLGGEWAVPRPVKTDPRDGSFVVTDVAVGRASLFFKAEGYASKTLSDLNIDEDVENQRLEVLLEPDAPVRGRITDASNDPIAGAQVAVRRKGGATGDDDSAESDEQGEYELRGVSPGELTLSFSATGFVAEQRTIDTRKASQLDVTLKRGLSLKGQVVDDAGRPVAEASVRAGSSVAGASEQFAMADDQGRFTLQGLLAGRYNVSVDSQVGSARADDVDVASSGPLRLVVERAKTAILTGKVLGIPEGGENAMILVMASNEDSGQAAQAALDPSRAFRMEDAPVGQVQVRAVVFSLNGGSMRSTRSVELTLAPSSETSTVLEFSQGLTVSGRITKDGAPLPFASLAFSGEQDLSARTDGRGAYEVGGLEPGPYVVTVQSEKRPFKSRHLLTASTTLDIDVTGAAIRGRVVRAGGGAPVSGVEVSCFRLGPDENSPESSVTSDAQGSFVETGLPEGRYRLITSRSGFGQEVRDVELHRGEALDVVFELAPADGLTVTVVDARDQHPLEAIVVVRDEARRIVANRHSGVEADGSLNIPLAAGSYILSTSATGYGTATLKVQAPGQGLKIGLTPGGTVVFESARDLRGRVRLIQPDGEEYVRCWCNGIADIELKGRKTVVQNIAPGTYVVELVDAPESSRSSVIVVEGQTSTIILP